MARVCKRTSIAFCPQNGNVRGSHGCQLDVGATVGSGKQGDLFPFQLSCFLCAGQISGTGDRDRGFHSVPTGPGASHSDRRRSRFPRCRRDDCGTPPVFGDPSLPAWHKKKGPPLGLGYSPYSTRSASICLFMDGHHQDAAQAFDPLSHEGWRGGAAGYFENLPDRDHTILRQVVF